MDARDDNAVPVKLINQKEVARMYSVTPKTVRVWVKLGRIPKPRIDQKNFKRWLYADIARHIESLGQAQYDEAES